MWSINQLRLLHENKSYQELIIANLIISINSVGQCVVPDAC